MVSQRSISATRLTLLLAVNACWGIYYGPYVSLKKRNQQWIPTKRTSETAYV